MVTFIDCPAIAAAVAEIPTMDSTDESELGSVWLAYPSGDTDTHLNAEIGMEAVNTSTDDPAGPGGPGGP